jgi:hypothetical protein
MSTATAAPTMVGSSWFDRMVRKIKKAASAVVNWFARGARATGRGAKKVGHGLLVVGNYALRGLGYLGYGALWVVNFAANAVKVVLLVAMLLVMAVALGIFILAESILGLIQFVLHYASSFFAWLSMKNRPTLREVHEVRRVAREERTERWISKVAHRFGGVTEYDEQAEVWLPGDIAVEEPVVPVDENIHDVVELNDEATVIDEHTSMETFSAAEQDPLYFDWSTVAISPDVLTMFKMLSDSSSEPEVKGLYMGRRAAGEHYLDNPVSWEESLNRARSLIVMHYRNQQDKYPAKYIRAGFDAQVRDIRSQIAASVS